jgi:hypothetical protein
MRILHASALCAGLLALALAATSCDDGDDYDHRVPPGLGTLLIDNETYDDISVFLDGYFQERVAREDRVTPYDLEPGIYRVVLEQRGGRNSFRGDIDVLSGRRTIIEVFPGDYNEDRYYVSVFFD